MLVGVPNCNLNDSWYSTHDMSGSAQHPIFDQHKEDILFRSITSLLQVIKENSASQTATEAPFFFCNAKNHNMTPEERHQFRINSALSVCAVRNEEVLTVLSSTKKTADHISSSYVVVVNPSSKKHLESCDVLSYRIESNPKVPHLVSGQADKSVLDDARFIESFV